MTTQLGSRMSTMGSGNLFRNVAGSLTQNAGNALVKFLADKIRGEGFKLSGEGRKKRVGRPKKAGTKKRCW